MKYRRTTAVAAANSACLLPDGDIEGLGELTVGDGVIGGSV